MTWINLDGLHDTGIVRQLGEAFGVHPLVLEDIVTTTQRPKFEDHGDHLVFILRMLTFESEKNEVHSEQLSLILTPECLLTFQENIGDCFDPVRARIRIGKGRLYTLGADYLAYALTDTIVDNYFIVLEQIGDAHRGARGFARRGSRVTPPAGSPCAEARDDPAAQGASGRCATSSPRWSARTRR